METRFPRTVIRRAMRGTVVALVRGLSHAARGELVPCRATSFAFLDGFVTAQQGE
jgi:hypothetical protein